MRVFSPILAVGLAGTLSVGIPICANATTLFSQPIDGPPFYTSQYDSVALGAFATTYDNFSLGTTSRIDTVRFKGTFATPAPAGGPPGTIPAPAGTITGFTLQFYDDSGGEPGTSVYSLAVAGNAHQAYEFTYADPAYDVYDYRISLPGSGFTAAGGTTYWISLVANLDTPLYWGWDVASGGPSDGISYQDFGTPLNLRADDLTFELAQVPEPPSWALMLAGLIGMAGLGIRRQKA